jgi:lysophospholipase L1-like esterase
MSRLRVGLVTVLIAAGFCAASAPVVAAPASSLWIGTPATLTPLHSYVAGSEASGSVPCEQNRTVEIPWNLGTRTVTGCLAAYRGVTQIGDLINNATVLSSASFVKLFQNGSLMGFYCAGVVYGCYVKEMQVDYYDYGVVSGLNVGLRLHASPVGPYLADAFGPIGVDSFSMAGDPNSSTFVAVAPSRSSVVVWSARQATPPTVVGGTPSPNIGISLTTAVAISGRYAAFSTGNYGTLNVADLGYCGTPNSNAQVLTSGCTSRTLAQITGTPAHNPQGVYFIRFAGDAVINFVASRTLLNSDTTNRTWFSLASTGAVADRYVALGDSFSAGEGAADGANPYEPGTDHRIGIWPQLQAVNLCHRTANAYPALLAPTATSDSVTPQSFANVACSGATVENVFHGQYNEGPQLDALHTADHVARVVTLGIGGNDIEFADIVASCVTPFTLHVNCYQSPSDRTRLARTIQQAWGPLVATYAEVRRSAPKAEIYVVGYPLMVQEQSECVSGATLGDPERKLANQVVNYLNDVIASASRFAGVKYVDVSHALDGHRFCQRHPWVNGLRAGDDIPSSNIPLVANESFHPTREGQSAIAATVLDKEPQLGHKTDLIPCTVVGASINPCPDKSESPPVLPSDWASDPAAGNVRAARASYSGPVGFVHLDALQPGTSATATIYSTPVALGSVTVGADGIATFQVPANIDPGPHVVAFSGTNLDGSPVRAFLPYVAPGPDGDLDADGISDAQDPCPVTPAAGPPVDIDADGRDDACDLRLDDGPAGDFDDDALTNAEEAQRHTDPLLADTDDDGLADGVEVLAGTDPLDRDSPGVGGKSSSTALASSSNPSIVGQRVTFTATVSRGVGSTTTPTGSVTFSDGDATLGTAQLVNGTADFGTSGLIAGTHAVTAAYQGNLEYAASTSTAVRQVVSVGQDATVTVTGAVQPHKASSKLRLKIQNRSVAPLRLESKDVTVTATVNGVQVDPDQIVLPLLDASLKKNASVNLQVSWHHGTQLRIGDDVIVTGCSVNLGDPAPANNCSSVSTHVTDVDLSTTTSIVAATARKGATKTKFRIGVVNRASQKAMPFRTDNVVVAATLNGNPMPGGPIRAPKAAPGAVNVGRTKFFAFSSGDHGRLAVGDLIEVTSCVVGIPANDAVNPCSTSRRVVVP